MSGGKTRTSVCQRRVQVELKMSELSDGLRDEEERLRKESVSHDMRLREREKVIVYTT